MSYEVVTPSILKSSLVIRIDIPRETYLVEADIRWQHEHTQAAGGGVVVAVVLPILHLITNLINNLLHIQQRYGVFERTPEKMFREIIKENLKNKVLISSFIYDGEICSYPFNALSTMGFRKCTRSCSPFPSR